MHIYDLTASVGWESGHGLPGSSQAAAVNMLARPLSSEGLTGEGSTSDLTWLLAGFSSLRSV